MNFPKVEWDCIAVASRVFSYFLVPLALKICGIAFQDGVQALFLLALSSVVIYGAKDWMTMVGELGG